MSKFVILQLAVKYIRSMANRHRYVLNFVLWDLHRLITICWNL